MTSTQYVPPAPVAATTVFRAVYYARDRRAFFEHVAGYTTRKLVFDLNPRQYRLDDVVDDLRAAGFDRVVTRPFFVPQRLALPAAAVWAFRLAERSGPAREARAPVSLHVPGGRVSADEMVDVTRQLRPTYSGTKPKPTRAPSSRKSLLLGSSFAGLNVSASTSTRHGPGGGRSSTVRDSQGLTSSVRDDVTDASVGLLVRADVDRPDANAHRARHTRRRAERLSRAESRARTRVRLR